MDPRTEGGTVARGRTERAAAQAPRRRVALTVLASAVVGVLISVATVVYLNAADPPERVSEPLVLVVLAAPPLCALGGAVFASVRWRSAGSAPRRVCTAFAWVLLPVGLLVLAWLTYALGA